MSEGSPISRGPPMRDRMRVARQSAVEACNSPIGPDSLTMHIAKCGRIRRLHNARPYTAPKLRLTCKLDKSRTGGDHEYRTDVQDRLADDCGTLDPGCRLDPQRTYQCPAAIVTAAGPTIEQRQL